MEKYIDFIISNQLLSGGFSYSTRNDGFVEPSCISLLALYSFDKSISAIKKGLEWLLTMHHHDGGWKMFFDDDDSSPVATALALITLQFIDSKRYLPYIERGIKYLSHAKDYWNNKELDENVWGWDDGTFIATEPTSIVVLAYKLSGDTKNKRLQEAKKFFLHNKCLCEGWTYGYPIDSNDPKSTSVVYVPLSHQYHITALVLLALQKENIDVNSHISLLEKDYVKSFCPMSISLGALALQAYGKNPVKLIDRLNTLMQQDSYINSMVIYNAYAVLGNLTLRGINPLWIRK